MTFGDDLDRIDRPCQFLHRSSSMRPTGPWVPMGSVAEWIEIPRRRRSPQRSLRPQSNGSAGRSDTRAARPAHGPWRWTGPPGRARRWWRPRSMGKVHRLHAPGRSGLVDGWLGSRRHLVSLLSWCHLDQRKYALVSQLAEVEGDSRCGTGRAWAPRPGCCRRAGLHNDGEARVENLIGRTDQPEASSVTMGSGEHSFRPAGRRRSRLWLNGWLPRYPRR